MKQLGTAGVIAATPPIFHGCGDVASADSVASFDELAEVPSRMEIKSTPVVVTFQPTSAFIRNPERGLAPWGDDPMVPNASYFDYALMPLIVEQDASLVRTQTMLEGLENTATIPQSRVNAMAEGFNILRQRGLKSIHRFFYTSPSDDNYQNAPEADLTTLLGHVEQLGPVMQANKDVIALIEAGFVGPWGEWHSSLHQHLLLEPRTLIRNKLLEAFPGKIMFRYPYHIREWYQESITNLTGGPSEARRIGMHNDGILTIGMHNGHTWQSSDFDANDIADDRQYISRLTALNPYGGEIAPGLWTGNFYFMEGPNPRGVDHVNEDFYRNHMTYLNSANAGFDRLKATLEAANTWSYPEMIRRLGYRFVLTEATHESWTVNGGSFTLRLKLRNEGYARIMNERPVYLRLVPRLPGAAIREYKLNDVNVWNWDPTYPDNPDHDTGPQLVWLGQIAAGEYDVGIRMPDSSPSLAADPRYCVRPANAEVAASSTQSRQGWDATTGTFMLGSRVHVW